MWKVLVGFFAVAIFSVGAHAATLTAISQNSIVSDFTITFNDSDHDGVFSLDELVSFSGVTHTSTIYTYDTIVTVPVVPGYADGDPSVLWHFYASPDPSHYLYASASNWTYTLDPPLPEPTPPALPLFASGLTVIGFVGWKRRRDAGRTARKTA